MARYRSSKQRCFICDFQEGQGSEYADQAADPSVSVVYDSRYDDYLCTRCLGSIDSTLRSFNV